WLCRALRFAGPGHRGHDECDVRYANLGGSWACPRAAFAMDVLRPYSGPSRRFGDDMARLVVVAVHNGDHALHLWAHEGLALRLLVLASAPLWAAHDFLAGSLPGLLADLACIVIGGWMLLKYVPGKWKPRQQECS